MSDIRRSGAIRRCCPVVCAIAVSAFTQTPNPRLPRFEDYPVATIYHGPISPPKLSQQEELYQKAIAEGIQNGVNFAGKYIVIQFKIGNGPLGVILVDARTGNVAMLPKEVAGDGHFVANTSCLAFNEAKPYLDPQDNQVLSFRVDSELVIIRQCTDTGFVRRFYHLTKGKWSFVMRLVPPPPPPVR